MSRRSCTPDAAATIRSPPPRASGRWMPAPSSMRAVRELQQVMLEHAIARSRQRAHAGVHAHAARPAGGRRALDAVAFLAARARPRAPAAAARAAAVLPLGSGAIAGCAFPISRVLLQGSLGFARLSPNSIDAVSDRDFVAELLFALSMLGDPPLAARRRSDSLRLERVRLRAVRRLRSRPARA